MSFLRRGIQTAPNYPSILAAVARSLAPGCSYHSLTTATGRPTAAYYDELVNVAGRDRDFVTLRNLLNKRIRDGAFNTNDTFKFLTATESSLSALGDLLQTLARLDGGLTRKNAFDTLIARLCKIGRLQDALAVADAMLGGSCAASAITFHPILCVLTRQRETERAWRVVEAARKKGIPPDVTAYNYFLTSHAVVGDLHAVAEVLERMAVEGVTADARTYDALVLGPCRAGKLEAALAVLRRTDEEEIWPLYSTFVHIIKAMLTLGYHVQAAELVRSYGGRDEALDAENFGVLASGLIKLKKFEEAMLVLEEMVGRGLRMQQKLRDFYVISVNQRERKTIN